MVIHRKKLNIGLNYSIVQIVYYIYKFLLNQCASAELCQCNKTRIIHSWTR